MLDYNEFYLTLVRHGQSVVNQNPDLMGQEADTPLSNEGEKQAFLLGTRLAKEGKVIDYAWSSTYIRARDTANIALANVAHCGLSLTPELREYDAGDWTGASRKEVLSTSIKNKMNNMGHGFLPPNGESLHQVSRRSSQWLEDNILYNKKIIKEAQSLKDEDESPLNIYLFSHGMTIKCLLQYVMGFDPSFTWKVSIDNTSITKLYFGKDGWRLLSINDCSHLNSLSTVL